MADEAKEMESLKDQVRVMQQRIDELSNTGDVQPSVPPSPEAPVAPSPQASGPPLPVNSAVQPADQEKRGRVPSLTYAGLTIYGTVDVGIAYLNHGAPFSPDYAPGLPFLIQKFSNKPIFSVTNNGLSQSKVGISGVEPINSDLTAVFRAETGFNPVSGHLSNGPASLIDSNGKPLGSQTTSGDSSRAGQPFQGAAYAGLTSRTFGSLTIGRQNGLMADDLVKYDPQAQSQAFSPIGYSGTSGGLGDTEDKALDNAVKYGYSYGHARIALLHQFGSSSSIPQGADEVDIGADYGRLSIDALWGKVKGAVAAASLTAAQAATDPNTLAATISDNTAYSLQASYQLKPVKLYAGWERIKYANPAHPLANGVETIGGYVLSHVNDNAYSINKILQISWVGARYSVTPQFDLVAAYYQYNQSSYGKVACADASASTCSGEMHDASAVADYFLTKRFDVYSGVNYSRVTNGLAQGYLYTAAWAPMVGFRFNF
jgi:predicted porin